jgi:hypothetical protein
VVLADHTGMAMRPYVLRISGPRKFQRQQPIYAIEDLEITQTAFFRKMLVGSIQLLATAGHHKAISNERISDTYYVLRTGSFPYCPLTI